MTIRLNPYLNWRGQAREAMTFYQSALGGELEVMAFADLGGMGLPEDEQHHVMHANLTVSESVTVMGSDLPASVTHEIHNGTVSLSGDDEPTLRAWWDALVVGGSVDVALEAAPWGDYFGQLTDRFGISWMFNVAGAPQG